LSVKRESDVNATLLLVSLLSAGPQLTEPASPVESTGWYGAPSAITDGVSLSLLVGAMAAAGTQAKAITPAFALGGIGGFLVGGPVVHLQNRHGGRAAASLALRVTGMVVGAYISLAHAYSHCNSDNGTDGPNCDAFSGKEMLTISLPFAAAAIIDDALLARGTIPVRDVSTPAPPAAQIAGVVGPGYLGLRGTF
jgi:hypothetical protein